MGRDLKIHNHPYKKDYEECDCEYLDHSIVRTGKMCRHWVPNVSTKDIRTT